MAYLVNQSLAAYDQRFALSTSANVCAGCLLTRSRVVSCHDRCDALLQGRGDRQGAAAQGPADAGARRGSPPLVGPVHERTLHCGPARLLRLPRSPPGGRWHRRTPLLHPPRRHP
jgi:hypothetical protein